MIDGPFIPVFDDGEGAGWDGEVADVGSLPAATGSGAIYLVLNSTGLFWNKRTGLYRDEGVDTWNRLSNPTFEVMDTESTMSDTTDNTKKLDWELGSITTGNERTITAPDRDLDLGNVDFWQFDISGVTPSETAGKVWWNNTEYTLNVATGLGPVLQVGQEVMTVVYNGTASQIDNGDAVNGAAAFNAFLSVTPADATTHSGISNVLIATMDIAASSYGLATSFGAVRGIDVTAIPGSGGNVYVDPTNVGKLTKTRPEFPNYRILVGGVLDPGVSGKLAINIKETSRDSLFNSWDGSIRETINFIVSSNGTTITGSLSSTDGLDNLTLVFSDGFTLYDVSPAATLSLTAGSATDPQTNYVYIDKATKTLQASTSDWPTTEEHARISEVAVFTAARTETDGAARNQNWNDHVKTTDDNGHLLHITERLRQEAAKWHSGAEGSVTIDSATDPDTVTVSNTAGTVYQIHRQTFPILDMTQYTIDAVSTGSKTFTISDDGDLSSTFPDDRLIQVNGSTGNDKIFTIASTNYSDPDFVITVSETIPDATADGTIGDDIMVVNDSVTPYNSTLDLNTEILDSAGVALTNRSFSFVVWGVANKSGQKAHLMLNLPDGSYSSSASAIADALNYSVYDIPQKFQGVGFLIARFSFSLSASGSGTWTLDATEDLRGKLPNTAAGGGGGGGGGGATTFLGLTDTPSSYASQALKFPRVNAGETALELVTVSYPTSPTFTNVNITGTLDVAGVSTFEAAMGFELEPAVKVTTDFITLTNLATDADMDGTGTAILFRQDPLGGTTADSGKIAVITDLDWTTTASTRDSSMAFYVSVSGSLVEKARIGNQNGYFGVNTAAPTAQLSVNGTTILNQNYGSTGDTDIRGDTTSLLFCDASAHRVGIETTTPSHPLEINDGSGMKITGANGYSLFEIASGIEGDFNAHRTSAGSSNMNIRSIADDNTSDCNVRFNHQTGSTGDSAIVIYNSNSSNEQHKFRGSANDSFVCAQGGDFAVGTTSVSSGFKMEVSGNIKATSFLATNPGIFQARKTSSQTSTGSYATLTSWATEDFEDSEFTFTPATGVLTFDTAGTYALCAVVEVDGTTGNDRSTVAIKIQEDVGAGYIDITGCESKTYGPRNTAHPYSSAQINMFIRTFAATDEIKVLVDGTIDTLTMNYISARLTVYRLK